MVAYAGFGRVGLEITAPACGPSRLAMSVVQAAKTRFLVGRILLGVDLRSQRPCHEHLIALMERRIRREDVPKRISEFTKEHTKLFLNRQDGKKRTPLSLSDFIFDSRRQTREQPMPDTTPRRRGTEAIVHELDRQGVAEVSRANSFTSAQPSVRLFLGRVSGHDVQAFAQTARGRVREGDRGFPLRRR
ncbi:hypothetical protein [Bradyrhizobium erythrophlei]|uniref:hypothetical protein n=1 Tax=Bradyrhizobium erythrophlei TaxID=1437360 RepID=UPI0015C55799|nr:hypothetical protein [Bradyrhizobium erythrophlei]